MGRVKIAHRKGASEMAEFGRRRKALIVLHQAHSTPGRVGRQLEALGVDLDVRRPALGDTLPASLDEHDGVVVFGGPMSANDEDEWLRREIDWLAVPLAGAKPFLGLCLGAQMLARKLGAKVYSHEDRRGEVGYYPLDPTDEADLLCHARFPRHAYQWHFDGFELPRGARLLASGVGDFPIQAFRHGRGAIGLQFHPEVTYQMMCRWTTRGHERLSRPGARPREEHLGGWFQHDGAVSIWLQAFLAAWIADALPECSEPRMSSSVAGEGRAGATLLPAAAY
jgi:GMP synthase (glutamine-hydrolysing)